MAEFKDHFSAHAADYAQYRPKYPPELFDYLANLCPERSLAWDAATGNGQTALSLVRDFKKVIATDASAEQIARAQPHPQITYQVCVSEQTPFADASFDLVSASAALHWFDWTRFYPELKRVLKPRGVFAAWCYSHCRISADINTVIAEMYQHLLPFWPPERVYVDAGYQNIPFPLNEIAAPKFILQTNWDHREFTGYLNTWSGIRQYLQKQGPGALDNYWHRLSQAWGDLSEKKQIVWDLHLRVGTP